MVAKPKSQVQKFREAARAVETDEAEDRFNSTLKHLARTPPETKTLKDTNIADENGPHKEDQE